LNLCLFSCKKASRVCNENNPVRDHDWRGRAILCFR
jgi:hypothetical protein